MPTLIEKREYSEPNWEEFTWVINGQRIGGVFCELEGNEGKLKRVRLAIGIPHNAENVRIDTRQIKQIERDNTGKIKREVNEESYIVSYWSPILGIGRLLTIPRELVERQDDGPLFIQIEELSLYSVDLSNRPTYRYLE